MLYNFGFGQFHLVRSHFWKSKQYWFSQNSNIQNFRKSNFWRILPNEDLVFAKNLNFHISEMAKIKFLAIWKAHNSSKSHFSTFNFGQNWNISQFRTIKIGKITSFDYFKSLEFFQITILLLSNLAKTEILHNFEFLNFGKVTLLDNLFRLFIRVKCPF